MDIKRRNTARRFLVKTIIGAAIVFTLFALMTKPATSSANAASKPPSALILESKCDRVINAAPPGHKFAAMQRCLKYVRAHNLAVKCRAPRPIISPRMTVKHVQAEIQQRRIATSILNLGRKLRANRTTQVAIIAAATQESSIRNLGGGHGSSVGILQLIDSHGSSAWRRIPLNSARWFYCGTSEGMATGSNSGLDSRHCNGGARASRECKHSSASSCAQSVQRSGFPSAYRQWEPEAQRTYQLFLGQCVR